MARQKNSWKVIPVWIQLNVFFFQVSVLISYCYRDNSKIAVLELTICHEKNILKSRLFKMNKYKDINLHVQPKYSKHRLQMFTIKISVLGFISNLNDFRTFFKIPNMPISLKTEIIKTVIVNSYNISNL